MTSCLPHTQTSSRNAALSPFLNDCQKRSKPSVQVRAWVQDTPLLEEGDSSCHSTRITIMYLLGRRERTMPKGKYDFVVWEWRALLPALISAYGCDVNIKQHIKRQCSEIALDPCLPLHRQAPSPEGSLLLQLCFRSSQNRGMMLVRSSAPLGNESTLIRTQAEEHFALGSGNTHSSAVGLPFWAVLGEYGNKIQPFTDVGEMHHLQG